jgi:type II secretion system protein G
MASINKSLQPGFSVVELLISLGIIMLIMSFVVPGLAKVMGKGSAASTKNTLKVVNQAILDYQMDVHVVPSKLEDLQKRPEGMHGWSGPYLPENVVQEGEVLDAWHQAIVYKKNERGAKRPYELYSLGDPAKEEEKIEAF